MFVHKKKGRIALNIDILKIGQRINDLMIDNDIDYRTLCSYCQSCGVRLSPANLTNIVKGVDRGYSYQIFVCIAEFFETSVDYILGITDYPLPFGIETEFGNHIRNSADFTGLSPVSIEQIYNNLHEFTYCREFPNKRQKSIKSEYLTTLLDLFLDNWNFDMFYYIAKYKMYLNQAIQIISSSKENICQAKEYKKEAFSYLSEAEMRFTDIINEFVPERIEFEKEFQNIERQYDNTPFSEPVLIRGSSDNGND